MTVQRVVPNLRTDDPGAGRAFYEGLLGLELAMDLGWIATYRAAGTPSAQVSLMSADASAPEHPDVSVGVDDVDAVWARAQEEGWEVVHPLTDEEWGVRRFFVRDPAGHVVNVVEHRTA